MNSKKYPYILLFISLTILATIGLQVYWNFKNYQENKLHLINEVQIAFDNSIEHYYVEDIKNDYVAFINQDTLVDNDEFIDNVLNNPTLKKEFPKKNKAISKNKSIINSISNFEKQDSILNQPEVTLSVSYEVNKDSIGKAYSDLKSESDIKTKHNAKKVNPIDPSDISSIKVLRGKKMTDSISNLKKLTNTIVFSMTRDSIDFRKLSKSLNTELARKNIPISYSILHYKSDSLFDQFKSKSHIILDLETDSKSTYLPKGQKLKLKFSDPPLLTLEKSLTGIVLSLLLSLSIIGCILYLLKIINRQKKSDEIKNDLISNITHEFKTPITTVTTAIEGIRNFNTENDIEKTNRYLNISTHQLKKLEMMVEKLLETATLESDQLILQKEDTNITLLLKNLTERYRMICSDKIITFESNMNFIKLTVDPFHFENAISNLIDNALKYGGNKVDILLNHNEKVTIITVKDNGLGIEKNQRERIFEKFYRIQKGNQHDVKGFGIGLYYSKKIIEKHRSSIELISDTKETIFKITLANV